MISKDNDLGIDQECGSHSVWHMTYCPFVSQEQRPLHLHHTSLQKVASNPELALRDP